MKRVVRSLAVSSAVPRAQVESAVREVFNEKGFVDIREDPDDESMILARAPPRLLSWGEDVTVDIEANTVNLTVENTQQKFDWGSTDRLARQLATDIRASTGEEAPELSR